MIYIILCSAPKKPVLKEVCMIAFIATVVFFVFSLAFVLPTMFRGKELVWQYYAARTLLTLLSAFVSAGVSWLVGFFSGKLLTAIAVKVAEKTDAAFLTELTSGIEIVRAVIASLIACLVFGLIYLIARPLIGLATAPLARLFMKITPARKEKSAVPTSDVTVQTEMAEQSDVAAPDAQAEESVPTPAPDVKSAESVKKAKTPASRGFAQPAGKRNLPGALLGALCGFIVYCTLLAPTVGGIMMLGNFSPVFDMKLPEEIVGSDKSGFIDNVTNMKPDRINPDGIKPDGNGRFWVTGDASDGVKSFIGDADSDLSYETGSGMSVEYAQSVSRSFNKVYSTVGKVVRGVTSNPAIVTARIFGAEPIFRILTTYPTSAGKMSVLNEFNMIGDALRFAAAASDSNISTAEMGRRLDCFGRSFAKSTAAPAIISEIMRKAADGSTDEEVESEIFAFIVKYAAESTPDSIRADAGMICRLFSACINNEYLFGGKEINVKEMISDRDFMSDVIEVFLDNGHNEERMLGLLNAGLTDVLAELKVPKNGDALYSGFISGIGQAIEEKNAADLADVFSDYGIDLSAENAERIIALAGEGGADVGKILADACKKSLITDENGNPLDLSDKANFADVCPIVTVADLLFKKTGVKDPAKEADLLAEAICSITGAEGFGGSGDIDTKALLKAFGKSLDALSKTELFGKDSIPDTVALLLQSAEVKKATGIDAKKAANVAKTLGEYAEKESYESVLKSVSDTFDAVQKLADSNGGEDGKSLNEATASLIKSATPASIDFIKAVVDAESLEKICGKKETAETLSTVMSNMLDNFAEAKENGMTDEECEKEAEALGELVAMAGGEKPKVPDIRTFVGKMTASKIVMSTVIDISKDENGRLKNDPLGLSLNPSDSEKAEIADVLTDALAGDSAESKAEKVGAIGALLGVSLEVSGDRVVVKDAK